MYSINLAIPLVGIYLKKISKQMCKDQLITVSTQPLRGGQVFVVPSPSLQPDLLAPSSVFPQCREHSSSTVHTCNQVSLFPGNFLFYSLPFTGESSRRFAGWDKGGEAPPDRMDGIKLQESSACSHPCRSKCRS